MELTIVNTENQSCFEPLMPPHLGEVPALCIGAIEDDIPCGILALTEQDTTLILDYLFVTESFRQRGIASAMLQKAHALARQGRMDTMLCQFSANERTEPLERCLSRNLFEKDPLDNPIYRITLGDLAPKYFGRSLKNPSSALLPLSSVTARLWTQFCDGVDHLSNDNGTVPTLKDKNGYVQDISFLLTKDNRAAGGILFDTWENSYILSYLCAFGNTSSTELLSLFSASYRQLKKLGDGNLEIYINTLTGTTEKMVLQMTAQKAELVGRAATWYCLY